MNRNALASLGALGLTVALALTSLASLTPAGALARHPATDPAPDPGTGTGTGAGTGTRAEEFVGYLRAAKRATAAYQDVAAAEADGYVRTSECVPGKGIHYLRSVAEGPEDIDLAQPNALVYAPRPGGGLKLLGIEYVSETPATIFGHVFEQSQVAFYYTLHVWMWESGPEDLFAADNPRITCEA